MEHGFCVYYALCLSMSIAYFLIVYFHYFEYYAEIIEVIHNRNGYYFYYYFLIKFNLTCFMRIFFKIFGIFSF